MKVTKYWTTKGEEIKVEYDETAPCKVCGEPVLEASMGGTDLCPWCDMGKCRYCGIDLPMYLVQQTKNHMAWHRDHPTNIYRQKEGT